jgi:hypothetical protein
MLLASVFFSVHRPASEKLNRLSVSAHWYNAPGNPGKTVPCDEWRLAHSMEEFKAWLDRGAPSDDAAPDSFQPVSPKR